MLLVFCCSLLCAQAPTETKEQHDARMQWWREARFGLFIHWGLYAVPAGIWNEKTTHGEWIRETAQIPVPEYEKFVSQFNPARFDAEAWVRLAKEAGMRYIVITSKHHDGFCMFDAQETDFDIMSTPFHRDVLKELAAACKREGIRLCFYHSIMDWHHPDYLPRRSWEKDRPEAGADFDRYVRYVKAELKELLGSYGDVGVLWFDGEWENTWTNDRGRDLYSYVRGLQPSIIINNRVGAGRSGMEGFSASGSFGGDFGTPEQQIPATGLPGVDWETCMTMNDHWGYNSHDKNWKSVPDLIRMLADIASKGGNFLLNVGPTAEGIFPGESVSRLRAIGAWMHENGEAIHGTLASPFADLPWGRCTQKAIAGGTRLCLHVFQWPSNGVLTVPGIFNEPMRASLLPERTGRLLTVSRHEDALEIAVPAKAPDTVNTVVVLDVKGRADINDPPVIDTSFTALCKTLDVRVTSPREKVEIHVTIDGTVPQATSPVVHTVMTLEGPCRLSARCFRDGKAVSGTAVQDFRRAVPMPSRIIDIRPGTPLFHYAYYEGEWDRLPAFHDLKPAAEGGIDSLSLASRKRSERYGMVFAGRLRAGAEGVYAFTLGSDDGSRLWIDDSLVVDNDGLHGMESRRGIVALMAGDHALHIEYFNKTGSEGLTLMWNRPGMIPVPLAGDGVVK